MQIRLPHLSTPNRSGAVLMREVSAELDVTVLAATTLEFQISLAPHPGAAVTEELDFIVSGESVPARELVGEHGGRIHRLNVDPGHVRAVYRATILGAAEPVVPSEFDTSLYLRPSRYAETDKFYGFAAKQFSGISDPVEQLSAVRRFVSERLDYVPGSSDPIDGAVDTLVASRGVCRDYAHLVIALMRALKVPARLVAVYAPGCNPMDFHAVAEVLVDGLWRAVDATGLAPRATMARICTGRDSSDTAFLDNHGGAIRLNWCAVDAQAQLLDAAGPEMLGEGASGVGEDPDELVSLG